MKRLLKLLTTKKSLNFNINLYKCLLICNFLNVVFCLFCLFVCLFSCLKMCCAIYLTFSGGKCHTDVEESSKTPKKHESNIIEEALEG